jgi:4-hydroxy-2-oxoheptanedioate aldolase
MLPDTRAIESFRDKLARGPVFGPFAKTSDPAFIECMGYGGFDFVILDMEHGPNGIETMQGLIRAAEVCGLFPVVRVEAGNYGMIGKALDIGACAVQVPQVTSVEELREIRAQAKFAPEGMRGVCRFVRAASYSATGRERYFRDANTTLLVIQLEGSEALARIDDIMAFGGFDIIFIGPYDLSQSLGVTGKVDHPLVEEKMRDIVQRCALKGVPVGNFTDTMENAAKWMRAGVRYISYSVDVGIFYESCKALTERLRCPPPP